MTYSEFAELKNGNKLIKRDDLRIYEFDTNEYYLTPEGKLILFLPSSPKDIKTFESVKEFKDLVEKLKKIPKQQHILSRYQHEIKNLPFTSQFLKEYLSKFLNINSIELDFSIYSLRIIDRAFITKNITQNIFFNRLYIYLVAYLGETLKKELNGEWKLKLSKEKIIEPYIITSSGEKINIFLRLFEVVKT